MERIFAEILQMSNTAAWVILAVLLVRVVLRKAPKKYSYWLWSVVGFRLCCPVTWRITLPAWALRLFSREQWGPAPAAPVAPVTEVTPVAPPTVTADIVTQNPLLAPVAEALPAPNPAASVDPIQVWLFIGAVIWCVGVVILLTYSVVSYFRLRRRMETAILLRDNTLLLMSRCRILKVYISGSSLYSVVLRLLMLMTTGSSSWFRISMNP